MRYGSAALLIALAAVFLLAGCGGGGSSTGSTSARPPSESESHKGASSEFISAGGENKYAKFGSEAPEPEREAASAVLEENLKARQAAEWEKQCRSLVKPLKEELAPEPGLQTLVKACGVGLGKLGRPLSASAESRKDTLPGEIDVLRVKGSSAYALYHGSDGKDYMMPMEKEGSEWKVASLVTVEIN